MPRRTGHSARFPRIVTSNSQDIVSIPRYRPPPSRYPMLFSITALSDKRTVEALPYKPPPNTAWLFRIDVPTPDTVSVDETALTPPPLPHSASPCHIFVAPDRIAVARWSMIAPPSPLATLLVLCCAGSVDKSGSVRRSMVVPRFAVL